MCVRTTIISSVHFEQMDLLGLLEFFSIILVIVLVVLYCVCCNFSCCVEHKHREGEVITNPLDPEHPYPLYPQQQEISQLQERIQQRRHNLQVRNKLSLREQVVITSLP